MTKIDRYNKIASAPKNMSKEIINAMGIGQGDKILEIGVGGGYYAKMFSKIVGKNGSYYGIDTDETFIENLNEISKSFSNITGIKILENEIPALKEKVDFIFIRNVYHHLENRTDYFKKISNLIKNKGKIVIIDYDESFSLFRFSGHYTRKSTIIKELKDANFSLIKDFQFLNKQSFLIFEKKRYIK